MWNRVSERTGGQPWSWWLTRARPTLDKVGGARMSIRGSGALYDACASVWCLEGDKDGPKLAQHEKARVTGRCRDDLLIYVEDVDAGPCRQVEPTKSKEERSETGWFRRPSAANRSSGAFRP